MPPNDLESFNNSATAHDVAISKVPAGGANICNLNLTFD